MTKQKIAIVTYNRIGEGQYENGLMEREDKSKEAHYKKQKPQ